MIICIQIILHLYCEDLKRAVHMAKQGERTTSRLSMVNMSSSTQLIAWSLSREAILLYLTNNRVS